MQQDAIGRKVVIHVVSDKLYLKLMMNPSLIINWELLLITECDNWVYSMPIAESC